jgi:hypothetical protein
VRVPEHVELCHANLRRMYSHVRLYVVLHLYMCVRLYVVLHARCVREHVERCHARAVIDPAESTRSVRVSLGYCGTAAVYRLWSQCHSTRPAGRAGGRGGRLSSPVGAYAYRRSTR